MEIFENNLSKKIHLFRTNCFYNLDKLSIFFKFNQNNFLSNYQLFSKIDELTVNSSKNLKAQFDYIHFYNNLKIEKRTSSNEQNMTNKL